MTTILTKGNKLTHFPNSKKHEVISFLTKKGMKQVIGKDKLKTNMDFYVA